MHIAVTTILLETIWICLCRPERLLLDYNQLILSFFYFEFHFLVFLIKLLDQCCSLLKAKAKAEAILFRLHNVFFTVGRRHRKYTCRHSVSYGLSAFVPNNMLLRLPGKPWNLTLSMYLWFRFGFTGRNIFISNPQTITIKRTVGCNKPYLKWMNTCQLSKLYVQRLSLMIFARCD